MSSENDSGSGSDSGRVVNTGDGYERVDETAAADDPEGPAGPDGPDATDADDADDDLGRTGWVLVAVVVLSFLVIPGAIYLRPTIPDEIGLRFIAAMLVLPFLPALLLGLTAVWSLVVGRE